MSTTPLKQARNKNAIEAAILNRVLDRDWTLNRRGPLSACVLECVLETLACRGVRAGPSKTFAPSNQFRDKKATLTLVSFHFELHVLQHPQG